MAEQEKQPAAAVCAECQFEDGQHALTCSKYEAQPAPMQGGEIEQSSVVRPDPTKRQTGKADPYAFTLTDKLFGEFAVLNSANGWWVDSGKVQALLQAYKIDCTDEEACAYAGISLDQLRYFAELHADFSRIKLACKQLPILRARKTVVESLEKSSAMATWYLERKRKEEFSARQEIAGPNGEEVISQTKRISKLIHDVEQLTAGAAPIAGRAPQDTPAAAAGAEAGGQGSSGPSGAGGTDSAPRPEAAATGTPPAQA